MTDPYDIYFDRLRPGRFTAQWDPNSVPQQDIPGFDQIGTSGFIEPDSVDTDQLADDAVTDAKVSAGTLTAQAFASSLAVPVIVASLPALPDADYPPDASVVFLSTNGKLYRNHDDEWTVEVESDDITSISADKITAGSLTAALILSGYIATAASGTRVEFDDDGIRAYNGSTLMINIPTDGSDVYINAEVRASALSVSGDAVFEGSANEFAAGSVSTLGSSISDPTIKPTLSQGWDTTTYAATVQSHRGLAYYATGTASENTPCLYELGSDGVSDFAIVEYLASDGSLSRSTSIEADLDVAPPQGIAVLGGDIYVTSWVGTVYKYDVATLTLQTSYSPTLPVSPARFPRMATDGTYLYIADTDSSEIVKWAKYNTSLVQQGSTVNTGYAITGDRITDCQYGSFDFGAERMLVTPINESTVRVFNSTGTRQSTEEFPLPSAESWGIAWDGSNIITSGLQYEDILCYHSGWTWTSASSVYWVGYSWYDSNATGGTHETLVSPLQSITMGRRKRLLVTTPVEPGAGGTDDPDNRRIYMYPNATVPASTSLDLQATTTEESHYLTDYDSAGAAPPVSNDFPGGTAAEISAVGGEWALYGDGKVTMPTPVRQVYTSSTTWTRPAGLNYIEVEVQGGGGPGGSAAATNASQSCVGGGGGGGGYARAIITAADLTAAGIDEGDGCTVTVGATKAASGTTAGDTQSNGNTSSFLWGTGTTVQGVGGGGGRNGTSGTYSSIATGGGGAGGSGPTGTIVANGGDGDRGIGNNTIFGSSPRGGSSALGGGGQGGRNGSVYDGNVYGGGGGGNANAASQSAGVGGDGAAGLIVVTEYYS